MERPGHKIRKANSVAMLERRLADAERGEVDAMELIGLHDEIARVERKWLEQIAAGSERRRPGDLDSIGHWYARLARQIERGLRGPLPDDATRSALQAVLLKARQKSPAS